MAFLQNAFPTSETLYYHYTCQVCDETFTKTCSIQYKKVAYEEKYRHCYRPLVKDCGGPKDPPMTTTPTPTPPPLPPCPPSPSTPLAFVIDTTKSQENDKLSISGLSNTMLDMIMTESASSIPNFLLTTFHDSAVLGPGNIPLYSEAIEDNVDPILDTEDAEQFRDSVHSIEYGLHPGYDTKVLSSIFSS